MVLLQVFALFILLPVRCDNSSAFCGFQGTDTVLAIVCIKLDKINGLNGFKLFRHLRTLRTDATHLSDFFHSLLLLLISFRRIRRNAIRSRRVCCTLLPFRLLSAVILRRRLEADWLLLCD